MRNKLWKRMLILVMSGALVIGTCLPSTAQTTVSESAEETGEDAFDDTADDQTFASCTLAALSTGEGSVTVSDTNAAKGDTVTVTAAPDTGYYLAQVRYTYEDADGEVTKVITETDGTYSFTMPADTAYVTADFISITWDGTIDLTWYDPEETTYTISYAAQWAGVAALNNGLFNDYPMHTNSDGNLVPNMTDEGLPYGYNESYYNTFTLDEETTVVVGDITMLKATCSEGSTGVYNSVTTNAYFYGPEDYDGKTILLDADLDMGGSYTGDRTDIDNWTGPNYMPVSGQYSMIPENGYTKLSSSFNGTFDGQGHIVYNIYCNRYAAGSYGDGSSVGLIGRMGCHDSDLEDLYSNPVVKNVAVDGIIYANRSVGGIVGKNGQGYGSLLSGCINFATVLNTDAKGCGGIIGAGWNDLTIKNCVNFGYIYTSYDKTCGGLAGSCEADVINSYNFGYVDSDTASAAQSLGTNNGGAVWTNCYWLTNSSVSNQAVYSSTSGSTITEVTDASYFKESDFITAICANTRDWVKDDATVIVSEAVQDCLENIYAYGSSLETYNGSGIAIPRAFINDTSTLETITTTGDPLTEYDAFDSFDADDLKIWAEYSDGTAEEITDYTITPETGGSVLTASDTYVVLSFTYNEEEYSLKYDITVTDTTLTSLTITSGPDNLVYALGEYFDTTGLVITAAFANGNSIALDDYTYDKTGALTAEDTTVTFSYTYGEITLTESITITMLPDEAPAVEDGVVQLENESDMMWFSNQVTIGSNPDAVVCNAITVTSEGFEPIGRTGTTSAPSYYTGTFDGQGYTVTLSLDESESYYTALFAGLGEGGVIRNLNLEGSVTAAKSYAAALLARATGGEIENVTSSAAVSGTSYVGGIVGCGADVTVSGCTNSGFIDASGNYSGGIGGNLTSGVLTGCINNGVITSSTTYCGGITGYASGSIVSCTNNGTVTSPSTNVGGIAGCMITDGSCITSCMNYGAITGTNQAGGIVGYLYAAITVSGCGNEGSVTTSSVKTGYLGGVAGYADTYAVTIDGCYNSGTLIAAGCAGGILGYVKAAARITNCYNTGSVTGAGSYSYVGGISAYTSYETTVKNCYNTGTGTYEGSSSTDYTAAVSSYIYQYSSGGLDNYSNNYGLEETAAFVFGNANGSAADSNAVFVTADTLKTYATIADGAESSVLGDSYAEDSYELNGGYPVLAWQNEPYDAAADAQAQADAEEVDALIAAIGTVTLDSEDAITAVRAAYEALSDAAKAYVTGLATLTEAESTYAALEEAYEQAQEEAAADAQAQADAAAVDALIAAIGEVTLDSSEAIAAARAAYDALSDAAKAYVTGLDTLTAAESTYAELAEAYEQAQADAAADAQAQEDAAAVDALIAAIGDVTLDSSEAIAAARAAYDALSDAAKAYVTGLETLTEAESTYAALVEAEQSVQDDTGDGNGSNDGGTVGGSKSSKKAQVIKVKKKSVKKTIKAKKLKNKKKTFKVKVTVKGKAKVTFKKKSGSKKLKINKKGKVTVKKGTKKGTYKMKVKVTAKATSAYKSKTKVIKVTVKVK